MKILPDTSKLRLIPLRTVLIYLAIAGAWIFASDRVLGWMVSDAATMERLSILKGWLFVGVTGALLFVVLRRQLHRIEVQVEARQRTLAELADQRQRLDSIIDGTNVGTWEWNVQTGAVVYNERWAAIVGYRLAELQPVSIQTWLRLLHPDDAAASERELERHFRGELSHYDCECRVRHKDGHWVWVHDRGRVTTRSADGRPLMMFGTHADITARKQTELALRESEERFRQIAETIHEVFWIREGVNVDAPIDYVSPAYTAIWGRSREGLLKGEHRWHESIHPEDRDRVMQAAGEKMLEGAYREHYRIVRPDGGVRWIADRAFPLRDETGRILRLIGTAEDVTEARRLEDQLRHAQKMQAMGTLAGGIAHDFNNLLGAIMGFAELTRLQLKDQPRERENVEDILRAGRRAIALVRQILTFSRRSSSQRVIMPLRPVVEEAVQLLRSSIPSTIELRCRIAADVPTVRADASQIHQVLMNLGTNAWHAMRQRPGMLGITATLREIGPADLRRDPRLHPGRFACIEVADTGTGIPPAMLDRVFEPFFTTKAPGDGTGLGLAVVDGIVREHEGFITVESAPGAGSTFSVFLPAAAGETDDRSSATGALPRGRGESILFVDDEPALVRLGVGMLEELAYTASGAEGAEEAIAQLTAHPGRFSLLITDHTMPGRTGLQLAAEARRIQPGLPVILVTGYAGEQLPQGSAESGVSELLLKPLSLSTLAESIKKAIIAHPPAA